MIGYPLLDIQRYLDDLNTERRLRAWQEDPEGMALALAKNVICFQDKAAMFRAMGDVDKALYYEELAEERLELLEGRGKLPPSTRRKETIMNDAKGRPIEVGDWAATPDVYITGGAIKIGAILGQIIEVTEYLVFLDNGINYDPDGIITLGGYVWVFCLECNAPWVKDMLQDETCPFCESERYTLDRPASPNSVAVCR
jgi:hypothetical protein